MAIEFEYTGGLGRKEGFCRRAALNFLVEIQPSAILTNWHLLPAEQPDPSYLVLDILNASSEEMELKYPMNKTMLIESKETCRIPIEIEPGIDQVKNSTSQVNLSYSLLTRPESVLGSFTASIPLSTAPVITELMNC